MMEPFEHHTGIAAPLMQINIDTDAIIPSSEIGIKKRFRGWIVCRMEILIP